MSPLYAKSPLHAPIDLNRPLVLFDVESTGPDPAADHMVELAAVKLWPDGREEHYERRFNPGRPIPPETTRIHGITDAMVAGLPRLRDAAAEVVDFLSGCDLCGFNAVHFDVPMLSRELAAIGVAWPAPDVLIVDVYRIYKRRERRDLAAAVAFYLGRPHAEAHTARGDVRATRDVLLAQILRYGLAPDVASLAAEGCPPARGAVE